MPNDNLIQRTLNNFSYFSGPNGVRSNPDCVLWLLLLVFLVAIARACASSPNEISAVMGGFLGGADPYQSEYINY